jgi:hypothetical protein
MLFGWKPAEAETAIQHWIEAGFLQRGVEIEGLRGEWIVLRDMRLENEE